MAARICSFRLRRLYRRRPALGRFTRALAAFSAFSQQQTPPKEPPVLLVGQSVMSQLRSHDQTLGPALEKGRFSNLVQKP